MVNKQVALCHRDHDSQQERRSKLRWGSVWDNRVSTPSVRYQRGNEQDACGQVFQAHRPNVPVTFDSTSEQTSSVIVEELLRIHFACSHGN